MRPAFSFTLAFLPNLSHRDNTIFVYVSDREREHDNDHRETCICTGEKCICDHAGCYAGTDDAAERSIG